MTRMRKGSLQPRIGRFAATVLSTQSSAMKGKRSEDLEQIAPPCTKGFWGDVALIRTSGFV